MSFDAFRKPFENIFSLTQSKVAKNSKQLKIYLEFFAKYLL